MGSASESTKSIESYKNVLTIPFAEEREKFSTYSTHSSDSLYSAEQEVRVNGIVSPILSVFDIAAYILHKVGKMTTMKLHKLLYYAQAWNLVWEEKPLFKEKIEAWANGPVIRELFNFHRGLYEISSLDLTVGNLSKVSNTQGENIDEVLSFYGNKSAQWLIDQTHYELPWRNARKGLLSNERGTTEISLEDMMEYYSSLK